MSRCSVWQKPLAAPPTPRARPFSIVTGGSRWIGMLTDYLTPLGLTRHLASIRVVDVTGTQILHDPQGSLDALAEPPLLP